MTNRLPAEVLSFDDFMLRHMADFGKRLLDAGRSRADARRWILDRFDAGGKFSLQSVGTDFSAENLVTGKVQPFRVEPLMVFRINNQAFTEFLEKEFKELPAAVQVEILKYASLLSEASSFVVWKLCLMFSDGTVPTAMGVFSFSELIEGKQIMAGVAAPVFVSMIGYMMIEGVMSYAGRWENEVA